jgi:hypothetical protein
VELEINMEYGKQDYRASQNLKKIQDVIMDNFSYDFQPESVESSEKEQENQLLNLLWITSA